MLYILILIALFIIVYKNIETLQNTKQITTDLPCKNCNIWNHVDANTKCQSICQKADINKPYEYTGKWKNDPKLKDSFCQCSKIAEYNKDYVGCALGNNCFIWNHSDAKTICPKICNRYLIDKNSNWTGNWKSTSIDSSACECEYYY
jgi:hypothetical protein